jgi:hypothetical protein
MRAAAKPEKNATRAEEIIGGAGKYIQVIAKLTSCKAKNTQGKEPAGMGTPVAGWQRQER